TAMSFDRPTRELPTTVKSVKSDNTWVWIGVTALTAVATWAVLESQKGSASPAEVQPNRNFISNGASRK
ncbi:MAG: hypothetical protein MJK18_06520, partial [Bdellovibrionales bacterium]|nr:hypothetical protein [Bdellovibrionales bacterium]